MQSFRVLELCATSMSTFNKTKAQKQESRMRYVLPGTPRIQHFSSPKLLNPQKVPPRLSLFGSNNVRSNRLPLPQRKLSFLRMSMLLVLALAVLSVRRLGRKWNNLTCRLSENEPSIPTHCCRCCRHSAIAFFFFFLRHTWRQKCVDTQLLLLFVIHTTTQQLQEWQDSISTT